MIPDLKTRLYDYVTVFNEEDTETYPQAIPNSGAYEYLAEQIPLLECPDPVIEKTYYYRFWTLRKHWKETPCGHILTEFHPPVGWAGPYNSINAAAGHHIREARWLRDPQWLREYILFWLNRNGNALSYSMWYASAAEDFFRLHPDAALDAECIDKLISLYEERTALNLHPCGLYWSNDDRDAMECSISGSGIRPTMNSYMIGDAEAISRMAARAGRWDVARTFADRAKDLREKMDRLLWDGDFYKVIPCEPKQEFPAETRPAVPPENDVREEIGYIPWMFGIPGADKSVAFRHLTDERGFAAPYGITTAERRHVRFLFPNSHECLWNGPVWPYATSQTLTALARHLHEHGEAAVTRSDYFYLLRQYAASHRLVRPDGTSVMWIDEDMDPFTGEWEARRILKKRSPGSDYERGKDYNHSTFCDLVLSGLLGIERRDERITADPLIPDDWEYFCVTNLTEKNITVAYDRTGERYGLGAGLHILG